MPRISSALVRIVRHSAPYRAQRPGALERLATPKELTKAREQQRGRVIAGRCPHRGVGRLTRRTLNA